MNIDKVFQSIYETTDAKIKEDILIEFQSTMTSGACSVIPYESIQNIFTKLNQLLKTHNSSNIIQIVFQIILRVFDSATPFEIERCANIILETILIHLADTSAKIKEFAFEIIKKYFRKTLNVEKILKKFLDFGLIHPSASVRASLTAMLYPILELDSLLFSKNENLFLIRKIIEQLIAASHQDPASAVNEQSQECLGIIFERNKKFLDILEKKILRDDYDKLKNILHEYKLKRGGMRANDQFILKDYGEKQFDFEEAFPTLLNEGDNAHQYFYRLAGEVFYTEEISELSTILESNEENIKNLEEGGSNQSNFDSTNQNMSTNKKLQNNRKIVKTFEFVSKNDKVFGLFHKKTIQDALKFSKDWRVRAFALEEIAIKLLQSERLDELFPYTFNFTKFIMYQLTSKNNTSINVILLVIISKLLDVPGFSQKFHTTLLLDELLLFFESENVSLREFCFNILLKAASIFNTEHLMIYLSRKFGLKNWVYQYEIVRLLINLVMDIKILWNDEKVSNRWTSVFSSMIQISAKILLNSKIKLVPKLKYAYEDFICIICKILPGNKGLQLLDTILPPKQFLYFTDIILEYQGSKLVIQNKKISRANLFDDLIAEELSSEFLKEAERYHMNSDPRMQPFLTGENDESFGIDNPEKLPKSVKFDLMFDKKEFNQSKNSPSDSPKSEKKQAKYLDDQFDLNKRLNDADENVPFYQKSKNIVDYIDANSKARKKITVTKDISDKSNDFVYEIEGEVYARKNNFDSLDDYVKKKYPNLAIETAINGDYIEEQEDSMDEGYEKHRFNTEKKLYKKDIAKLTKKENKKMLSENRRQKKLNIPYKPPKTPDVYIIPFEKLPRLKNPEEFANRIAKEYLLSSNAQEILKGLNGVRSIVKFDKELIYFHFFPLSKIMDQICLLLQSNDTQVVKTSLCVIKDLSYYLKRTLEIYIELLLSGLLSIYNHDLSDIRLEVLRVFKTLAKYTSDFKLMLLFLNFDEENFKKYKKAIAFCFEVIVERMEENFWQLPDHIKLLNFIVKLYYDYDKEVSELGESVLLKYFQRYLVLGREQKFFYDLQANQNEKTYDNIKGFLIQNIPKVAQLNETGKILTTIQVHTLPQKNETSIYKDNSNILRASSSNIINSKPTSASRLKFGLDYNPNKEANQILDVINFFNN